MKISHTTKKKNFSSLQYNAGYMLNTMPFKISFNKDTFLLQSIFKLVTNVRVSLIVYRIRHI